MPSHKEKWPKTKGQHSQSPHMLKNLHGRCSRKVEGFEFMDEDEKKEAFAQQATVYGSELREGNFVKAKREGIFVAREGESEKDQRERHIKEWNQRKSDNYPTKGAVKVRCCGCGHESNHKVQPKVRSTHRCDGTKDVSEFIYLGWNFVADTSPEFDSLMVLFKEDHPIQDVEQLNVLTKQFAQFLIKKKGHPQADIILKKYGKVASVVASGGTLQGGQGWTLDGLHRHLLRELGLKRATSKSNVLIKK